MACVGPLPDRRSVMTRLPVATDAKASTDVQTGFAAAVASSRRHR